ncbi:MAG: hypothetical protein MR411_01900 [Tenericutes bacterium]|nr:hypothetical protein [Mycoplasmatota bacterium]
MNKHQEQLLNLCGYHVDENGSIIKEDESKLSIILFDKETRLFNISISAYTFNPGDHDSIEYFSVELNHKLVLVYELNLVKDKCNE